jgi:hypothetical protein
MVVPITFNPNIFPDNRGKKVSGRKDGQVNFDDYLLERMEPVDSSPEPGRDRDQNAGGQSPRMRQREKHENDTVNDSHGGEEPGGPSSGRRIDLRA